MQKMYVRIILGHLLTAALVATGLIAWDLIIRGFAVWKVITLIATYLASYYCGLWHGVLWEQAGQEKQGQREETKND